MASSNDVAIVGIGINVNQREVDFPPDVRERATSLRLAAGGRMQGQR